VAVDCGEPPGAGAVFQLPAGLARDGCQFGWSSVTDDGKGLPNVDRLGPRGDGLEGGFGMGGMRERAELVGGELEFGPAPGKGTTVRLTVPLAGRPSAQEEAATARRAPAVKALAR